MEDWQEWQIQADEVAAGLNKDVDSLELVTFGEDSVDRTFRGFWPRFRDLKERVRVAPAIRLEDKLALERRLRNLGSRAYKAQEETYARSGERKNELMPEIEAVREAAEGAANPRALRDLRKQMDEIRRRFDGGPSLVPADRQALWDTWRAVNDLVWQKLNSLWDENEELMRQTLAEGTTALESGNSQAVRQSVIKFFDLLRTREAKQASVNKMKAEADNLRRQADEVEERRQAERLTSQRIQTGSPIQNWRSELERHRENAARLSDEVAGLEARFAETSSILDQAMIRGNLVDKKRKLAELERSSRVLVQRIEQAEESPVLSAGG